jgi:tRNA nucleotidyltransferase (CCA-adding enzyme)
VFETPDIVEDELYPQLEKSRNGITDQFTQTGFDVIRSAVFANDQSVLWFELDRETLPAIERHVGPPIAARDHAERFYETYESQDVYGPFIHNNRYIVERERTITSARSVCSLDNLGETRIGPAVNSEIEDHYEVLIGRETAVLVDEFGEELARYFDPTP